MSRPSCFACVCHWWAVFLKGGENERKEKRKRSFVCPKWLVISCSSSHHAILENKEVDCKLPFLTKARDWPCDLINCPCRLSTFSITPWNRKRCSRYQLQRPCEFSSPVSLNAFSVPRNFLHLNNKLQHQSYTVKLQILLNSRHRLLHPGTHY